MNPLRADGSPDPDAPRLTKRPRVHDLRHTHASWMIAAGVDLFILQRRLGHESITTTTETYAHLLPDQQARRGGRRGKSVERARHPAAMTADARSVNVASSPCL